VREHGEISNIMLERRNGPRIFDSDSQTIVDRIKARRWPSSFRRTIEHIVYQRLLFRGRDIRVGGSIPRWVELTIGPPAHLRSEQEIVGKRGQVRIEGPCICRPVPRLVKKARIGEVLDLTVNDFHLNFPQSVRPDATTARAGTGTGPKRRSSWRSPSTKRCGGL
jgi:hypothetical protein